MGIISFLRNAIVNPYWGAVGTPFLLPYPPTYNRSYNRPFALQYIARLQALHNLGVLKGRVFYPVIGKDLFPAFFAEVIGIDAYRGTGIAESELIARTERKILIGLELSRVLAQKQCRLKIISANIFHEEHYVPEIQASGQIDVLYLKGLKHWVEFYVSFPGGGLKFSRYKDAAVFDAELDRCVRGFVRSMAEKLLKPGGFIVLADNEDMGYIGYIVKELGFADYLDSLGPSPEKDLLFSGSAGRECFLSGTADSVSVSLGEIPMRILKKPS